MILDLKKPTQPKKITEKQEELRKLLQQHLNVEPATFFSDACKIMNDECNLEARTNLVSHLLREIIGEITNKLLPPDFKEKIARTTLLAKNDFSVGANAGYQIKVIDNNPTYKDKIEFIVNEFKIKANNRDIQFWKEVLADNQRGWHKYAHRSNVQGIRKVDALFQERWERTQSLLFFQIQLIKDKILEDYKILDEYLLKKNLSDKDIAVLKVHVPLNSFTLDYFFSRSTHFQSISRLNEKGLFDYPTPPKKHESGGTSFPHWPQAQFLLGAASQEESLHDEVLNICLGAETENYNVQHSIIEIIKKLSPNKAIKFKDKAKKWLESQVYWVDHKVYGELITYYASNGYCKEAVDLVKALLKVKPNPRQAVLVDGYKMGHDPVGIIGEHEYREFLNNYLPKIAEFCGLNIIKILLSTLEDYITINSSDNGYDKDDYSDIWRPSIEKDPKYNINNFLVSAIRDISKSYLQRRPNDTPKLIALFNVCKLNVIRRVKLYLLPLVSLDSSVLSNKKY